MQHGKLTNVFLQRKRNRGRKFRFGFVRYANKEDAVRAMESLDGVRLGGAYLSVKPEISAGKMKGGSRKQSYVSVAPPATVKDSRAKERLHLSGGFASSSRSWCDLLKGCSAKWIEKQPLLDSEVMLMGVGGCGGSNRISDHTFFPELEAAGRRKGEGMHRVSDALLFPEVAAWSYMDD